MKRMIVAIVGAGGFLGTNLVRYLAPKVGELRGFGRSRTFPDDLNSCLWTSGELTDDSVGDVVAGCDVVIHLASSSTPTTADKDIPADAQSNVIGSLNLIEQCRRRGVGRIVYLSSGGTVYGAPTLVPTPETASTDPITAYGVAKLAVEKYLEVYRRHYGIDYRVLRVANIYGPYQTGAKGQGAVATFLRRAIENSPIDIWGDGEVIRDYIYVGDVITAIASMLSGMHAERIFNVGSGYGTSLLEIVSAIEALLGRHMPVNFHPARPVDVPVSVLDHTRITRETGWAPAVHLAVGLRQTAEWMTTQWLPAYAGSARR